MDKSQQAPSGHAQLPKNLSVAICYGFLGGPAHSRELRQLLHTKGFDTTSDLERADIILAHSAGCFLIPAHARPKLVVYVGMPLAQAKPMATFVAANHGNILSALHNKTLAKVATIALRSWYYGIRQPQRNWTIMRTIKTAALTLPPGAIVTFIANRYDPWPRGNTLQQYLASAQSNSWIFMSLPGSHDNIWEQPERYVAIIDRYARLLA